MIKRNLGVVAAYDPAIVTPDAYQMVILSEASVGIS
jgi:hypothetical protein